MGKRFLILFCSFLIFSCFCINSFSCPVSAAGFGSHRGDYMDYSRSDIDTEKTFLDSAFDVLTDAYNNPEDFFSDLFYYCLGTAGAIFSDDTTLLGVRNQWNALYNNALDSPEDLRKIFYYGTDGQLYFTDEFLSNTRDIVDQASFEHGVLSIPYCTNDGIPQKAYSAGIVFLSNNITACLNGEDSRFIHPSYSTSYPYFNDGFSIQNLYKVTPFSSYSHYRNFCTGNSSTSVQVIFYNANDQLSLFSLSETIYPWFFNPSSDGTFKRGNKSPFNFDSGTSSFSANSNINTTTYFPCFLGAGSFESYRSYDWLDYYVHGGTGVLRGNTYYALDNAIDEDGLLNGSALYDQLQEHYKDLSQQVASGNLTLSEMNKTLSDEILDSLENIEQNTEVQTKYLKKIVDLLESISKKLTYSNVVGTVNAASNLLSSIGDALDSLFEDSGGDFNLLDFVADGLSDSMRSVFPFSLPHDLLLVYEILAVTPQIPEVVLHFDLARLGISFDYTYTANDFQKLAYVTRFFSSIGFVILLINLTDKMMKK